MNTFAEEPGSQTLRWETPWQSRTYWGGWSSVCTDLFMMLLLYLPGITRWQSSTRWYLNLIIRVFFTLFPKIFTGWWNVNFLTNMWKVGNFLTNLWKIVNFSLICEKVSSLSVFKMWFSPSSENISKCHLVFHHEVKTPFLLYMYF